jgi:hypothetical protein
MKLGDITNKEIRAALDRALNGVLTEHLTGEVVVTAVLKKFYGLDWDQETGEILEDDKVVGEMGHWSVKDRELSVVIKSHTAIDFIPITITI